MQLRLGLVFTLGLVGSFLACSSSDSTNPITAQPDASTAGTDAGTQDTSDASDAGPVGPEVGDPITATPGTWTFVPFADSSCADGSPTGIGINPGTSKRLVIYMEGGGACWDANTCYGSLKLAANLDGWDETKFQARMKTTAKSHLDRTAANNPFKDASYVYIPYCTGDIHTGDKEQMYDGKVAKHVGRRNVAAFLKRIAPTFKDADRVVLTGSSAGGFGAAVNYWRAKQYWPTTRVDLIDDSGPPFSPDKMAYLPTWAAAWDLAGALDPDCTECANYNFPALLASYTKKSPESRFALLSYDHDYVISTFFNLSEAEFSVALADVTEKQFTTNAKVQAFEVAGTEHTMLGDLTTSSHGKDVGTWISDMESDAATWATVKP